MSKDQIDLINEQAYLSVFNDLEKASEYSARALAMAEESGYPEGRAWGLLNRGLVEMERGYYEHAFDELEKARGLFVEIGGDYRGRSAVLNALGLLHIRLGKMHEAFVYLQDSLDICSRHSIKDIEYTALNYMGIHQYRSERYNQALRFFQRSLSLSANRNSTSLMNNLGSTYRALKQNEKALDFLNRALLLSTEEDKPDARISIYEELGLTYGQMRDVDKAVSNLEKALEICTGLKSRRSPDLLIHLAEQYMERNEAGRAEEMLLRAEKMLDDSNEIGHRKLYLLCSRIEEDKGNATEALAHLKKYMSLCDKLKSLALEEEVWQLETSQYRSINRRVSSVAETGRKLTALLDRDEIIRTLEDSLSSLFSLDSCAVGLMEEDHLRLHYFNPVRREYGLKQVAIERQGDISSWVIRHGKALWINDLDNEIDEYLPAYNRDNVSFDIQSALCIPFETGMHSGLLGIYNRNKNSFNNEDREFLAMLCSYAAIAFENAAHTEIIKTKNRELTQLSRYDPLTRIYNRRHILHLLEQNWRQCRRSGSYLHIMIIDADNFKNINDNFGHDIGDLCLKKLAEVLERSLQRSSDCYGRYGGEEFIVSVQEMSVREAGIQAERIRKEVEGLRIPVSQGKIGMTVSIGLGSIIPPRDGDRPTLENLIKVADQNMYLSKSAGRNRVSTSAPLN